MQIFIQLIIWQQVKACRHGELFFRPNVIMEKKCDPSDFNCGKTKKYPVSSSSAGRNALLMRKRRREETGQSWQEGVSNTNNHTLQQWYAEEHPTHQCVKTLNWIGYRSRRPISPINKSDEYLMHCSVSRCWFGCKHISFGLESGLSQSPLYLQGITNKHWASCKNYKMQDENISS